MQRVLVPRSRKRLGQIPIPSTISANVSPVTQEYAASIQSQYQSATAGVQASVNQQTGSAQNTQRAEQGASDAASLVQNGYDPNSSGDNAKLVSAIAGGFVVAGLPFIGAGVEALWQVGNAIACPIVNAFASIGLGNSPPGCGGKVCQSSGTWTPAFILSSTPIPAMPKGSFAAFVLPALAYYSALTGNCQSSFPPDTVVDGAAAIWNQTHKGPTAAYYVPPLQQPPFGASIIPNSGPSDSNLVYGFGPSSAIPPGAYLQNSYTSSFLNIPTSTTARTIQINSGALIGGSSVSAVAGTVAKHAGVAAGGAIVGGLFYAWLTGQAVDKVFGSAWDTIKAATTGGLNSLEHFGGNLSLHERRRRR